VTVATFNYPVEAEMAKIRLESQGIKCVLANEILSRLDGPILEIYPVRVRVREEDARRAAELLAADRKDSG
jgi:hypothetical protein